MKITTISLGPTCLALASGLRVAIQLVLLPIIGRLLGPQVYGQVALVMPFIILSVLFADAGFGACIVRADRVTPALEGTVLCASVTLSLGLMAVFAILGAPLGALLHEPLFPSLLNAMSTIVLLASFCIVPSALLLRQKRYKWLAINEVAGVASGLVGVSIGIALGWGAWSLVAQQIALWLAKLTVVWIGARWVPRPIFRWSIVRDNARYGANLTGSSMLSFIARNIDNVLIGKFMGTQTLGYYALAFQIVGLPGMVLNSSVYYTVLTSTMEAKRNGGSSAALLLTVLRRVVTISAPLMIGIAVTAGLSVPLILGDKWLPASLLIMLLAPLGVTQSMNPVFGACMAGLGRADVQFKAVLTACSGTITAICLGVAVNSTTVVAAGIALAALTYPILASSLVSRALRIGYRPIILALFHPLFAALLMGAAVMLLRGVLPPDLPPAFGLPICIAAGILTYGIIMATLRPAGLDQDIGEIKQTLRRLRYRRVQPIGLAAPAATHDTGRLR